MLKEVKNGLVELRSFRIKSLSQKVSKYTLRRFPKVKNFLLQKKSNIKIDLLLKQNAKKKALFENVTIIYILNNTDKELLISSIISLKNNIVNPKVLFIDFSNNDDEIFDVIQNYLPKASVINHSPNERLNAIFTNLYDMYELRDNILVVNDLVKFNSLSHLLDNKKIEENKLYAVDFIHKKFSGAKHFYIGEKNINFYQNRNLFRSFYPLFNKINLENINFEKFLARDFEILPAFLSTNKISKSFKENNIFFSYFNRKFPFISLNENEQENYRFEFDKLVSIIIPTRDKIDLLKSCIKSIENSSYENYEIIIIDHQSSEKSKEYLKSLDHKVIEYNKEYNFSDMNNIGAKYAKGEVLCFLNNDTQIITEDWMEILGSFALREDVGAVGAKLLFKNKTIQHAGVIVSPKLDRSSHVLTYEKDNLVSKELNFISSPHAVTGACLVIEKKKFNEVKKFDENFKIIWQDVDLCFTLSEKGYKTLFIPYVKLFHFESKTRKLFPSENEVLDTKYFQSKWEKLSL